MIINLITYLACSGSEAEGFAPIALRAAVIPTAGLAAGTLKYTTMSQHIACTTIGSE